MVKGISRDVQYGINEGRFRLVLKAIRTNGYVVLKDVKSKYFLDRMVKHGLLKSPVNHGFADFRYYPNDSNA